MSSDSPQGQPPRARRGLWPFSAVFLIVFLLIVKGCGGCSSQTGTPTDGGSNRPAPPGQDVLDPFLTMTQPDQLGIRADVDQATSLLNQWRMVHMEKAKKDPQEERFSAPLAEETRKLLERDLSAEAVKRAERDDFTADDVRHIRTARLMKAIVNHVANGVDTELGRAQAAFDYVTWNMQLVSGDKALPLTPYEMLVFGEGTAEDRAWVFAELLRQLNQDAVIVRSLAEPTESAPWFVGAVVNNEIRLFDPLRSTPVPVLLSARIQDIAPATIAELSQPMVLDSLTAGTEAKLSPQMFEKVRLEIIGASGLWSPRMAEFQPFLAGETSAVISQKLTGESGDDAAMLARIASLEDPQKSVKDIRLWSHPENRLEGFAAAGALRERWNPFEAPIAIEPNTGQPIPGQFSRLQIRTRTLQLMGEYDAAIPSYSQVLVRHLRWLDVLDPEVLSFHADAAEDAHFWSAVCQMELGDYEAAAGKLAAYIKNYERFASRHGDQARVLLARSLMELDRPKEAALAISPLKPTSPEYATAMFLKHALDAAERPKASAENPKPKVPETPNPKTPNPHQPAIAEKPAALTVPE